MVLKSWLSIPPDSNFPLQNLPYGVFSTTSDVERRPGIAIGEYILDLKAASRKLEAFSKTAAAKSGALEKETLNHFMSLGRPAWKEVRDAATKVLSANESALRDHKSVKQFLIPRKDAIMHLPASIGDYTDFYACPEHAKNGTQIRTGLRTLMNNWLHLPVAYHGRSSSVVVSGTAVHRPWGQTTPSSSNPSLLYKLYKGLQWLFGLARVISKPQPSAKASSSMDYELEMACFIGPGNKQGEAISTEEAPDHIFGLVLMNDWSARDFQRWEMLPLGPFNSKNFATSISPWIVPLDALEPFRRPAKEQSPVVLPYLQEKQRTLFDIQLQASVAPNGKEATTVSQTNLQELYWTLEQMIAHHTFGGCNLRPGDLLGTGTISSPVPGGQGSLLELSWGGSREVALQNGEKRKFLLDGDTVTLSGYCQGEGYRVGFGECTGTVLAAI